MNGNFMKQNKLKNKIKKSFFGVGGNLVRNRKISERGKKASLNKSYQTLVL